MPDSLWAQTYITEIIVATGRDGKPQTELYNIGYKYINQDLNKGNKGSDDVILGYKKSKNPDDAITNIVILTSDTEIKEDEKIIDLSDGRTYHKAKASNGSSSDLNKNAGGDFLYLFYTKDKPELGVVTDIEWEGSNGSCANPIALVKGNKITEEAANTNRGTKGDRIYLSLKKNVVIKEGVPRVAEEFKAEALGGKLYKFTIPLGILVDKEEYILADPDFNNKNSIYAIINGTEELIGTICNINRDKDNFDCKWGCEYTPKSNRVMAIKNPYETGDITKMEGIQYGYTAYEGNNTDLRLLTFFFMTNDTTTVSSFGYKGTGEINYSEKTNTKFDYCVHVNSPSAPEGMNTISVIDPVFDITAGKSGSSAQIGSQLVNVITSGVIDWVGVWDIEDQKFLFSGENSGKEKQLNYYFPAEDKTKHYTVLLWGENKMMTDTGMSENNGWFAVPLTVKPVHSIKAMDVTTEKEVDEKGNFQLINKVQWIVDNAYDEDAIDVDEYLIQRAELPDFSDAITIGSVSVDAASADSTTLRMEGDTGIFTYIDDLEGNAYNTKGGNNLYYRVIRAMMLANWGSLRYGDFVKTDSIGVNNYLATVDTLSVKKTDDFEQDGTVKVRVELTNKEVARNLKEVDLYTLDENSEVDVLLWNKPHQKYFGKITDDGASLCERMDDVQKFTLRKKEHKYYILNKYNPNQLLTFDSFRVCCWGDYDKINFHGFYKNSGLLDVEFMYDYGYEVGGHGYLRVSNDKKLAVLKVAPLPEWKLVYDHEIVWDPNASIVIKRYAEERDTIIGADGQKTTVDLAAKTLTINGSDVKWDAEKKNYYAEIEDIQTLPYTHYYYKAFIDASNSKYPILKNDTIATSKEDADACVKETIAPVAHLEATMGTHKGGVALEWEAEEGLLDGFKLERREVAFVLGENEAKKTIVEYFDPLEEYNLSVQNGDELFFNIDGNDIVCNAQNLKENRLTMKFVPTGERIEYKDLYHPVYYIEARESGKDESKYFGKYSNDVSLNTEGGDKIAVNTTSKDKALKFIIAKLSDKPIEYLTIIPCENGVPSQCAFGVYNLNEDNRKVGLVNLSNLTDYKFEPAFSNDSTKKTSTDIIKETLTDIKLNYASTDPAKQKAFEIKPLKDIKANTFFDDVAESGKLYEYKVTSQCTVYGKTYKASRSVYGWNPYYGSVRGKVTLKNGAMMPSKVRVHIKGTENVNIVEVRDSLTDEVIIPGYNKVYEANYDTKDGTFEFENIPYFSEGTNYNVDIIAKDANFVLEGHEDNEEPEYQLADSSFEYNNIHYICNDTRQFSGRVLYKNSTIPVRDCEFEMNGCKVLDANGKPIVTDSKGEFMFSLPTMNMTLRVVKDGHTFADGGYILARESDKTGDNEYAFKPRADYDGLILTDSTTVRLVGRLIGGDKQGKLPLAMAKSKNNLGDNMRLVLELEGDNTSHITYFKEDPDRSSYSQTFTQQVSLTKTLGSSVIEVDTTNVTFEKKRIVIEPDVNTGEFCIDLAPTKYKITEMSATGYSTLFNEGEGFQVLDLSHSDTCRVTDIRTFAEEKTNGEETCTTSYNATYQRVVHNPVTITYEQYQYGMKKNFFGMETMATINAVGKKVKTTIAKYDKDTKSTTYMFKHPVYEVGRQYQLKVDIHEDYYYNGNKQSAPDIVYLDSCTLKVRNELVSNDCVEEYVLTPAMKGSLMFSFVANNPEFTLKKDAALRRLTMQAKVNGYYYEPEKPLEAFVTGVRDKGTDVLATIEGPINIVDVIRDPYGSKSYAYREKGTSYHWDYNLKVDINIGLNFDFTVGSSMSWFTGMWTGAGMGAFAGKNDGTDSYKPISLSIPIFDFAYTERGEYDMTLNDRISTSADPLDVGAMADVYLGFTTSYDLNRVETFSLIDQETYDLVKRGVDANAIRIIQEGEDENGEKFYLAISDKVAIGQKKTRDFAYTQKHIMGTIIPQLAQELDKVLLTGTKEEIHKMADESEKVLYRYIEDSKEFEYETIYPNKKEIKIKNQLTPESYMNSILGWREVISNNEVQKINHITSKSNVKSTSYSLSAATKIEHSEAASMSYVPSKPKLAVAGATLYGNDFGEWNSSFALGTSQQIFKSLTKYIQKKSENKTTQYSDSVSNNDNNKFAAHVDVLGHKFSLAITPNFHFNFDKNMSKKVVYSQGSGYVLETNDNSYLDIDVYQSDDYNLDREFINLANDEAKNESEKNEFEKRFWNWVATDPEETKVCRLNDFVFTVHGGAERQPWYEPDSTLVYALDTLGTRAPLTARTLRIDNPKISISNPVVSNIPVGDKAIFSIRLTNDSEVTTNMNKDFMNPSVFKLFLDENSCPDGLAITMDGMPLTDGRTFMLKPGESITKTIQVERAGTQYNYENVRLGFRDDACSLFDYAAISINYLPASTPLKMARPVDKWVLNTLSAKDEEGKYYLPVEVNGFNTTAYDNFDHIELQYKKKTEGDTKWVNMCSFYANDSLFNAASGTKEMLTSGTIKYRFYGDADPMEMEYDLRAVSFCRLGTGYVTAVSNVMSGLKDTRAPEVFGKPKPTNGVLSFEDVISFPFNEPIAYNYLDKTANFQITGITNNLNNEYDTALRFSELPGPDYEYPKVPTSKVKRSLAGQDFTWEAMIKLDTLNVSELISIYDKELSNSPSRRDFTLMYDNGKLSAIMDGISFDSKTLTNDQNDALRSKLTNVAVTFTNDDVGINNQVKFYVDGAEIDVEKVCRHGQHIFEEDSALMVVNEDYHITSNVYGEIFLGSYMTGLMVDARLWDKALSGAEIASKRKKVLSKNEPSLLCYWPMNEMMGNVLHDKVNGTDLHFTRQTWQMPTGQHSLKLEGRGVALNTEKMEFMRAEYNDFTLSFWTKIDSVPETKSDSNIVHIFSAGTPHQKQYFAIYMNNDDVFVQSGDFRQSIASTNYLADHRWHLVTAVTNKSFNSSSVYIDGKMVMSADGDKFKGMPRDVKIGDDKFYGGFDNIAFWHLAIPGNSLTTVSNAAPSGKEMGLVFFMPFEMDKSNSQDSHYYVFSPYNMVVSKDDEGNDLKTPYLALPEDMMNEHIIKEIDDTESYPPTRTFSIIQNIPFTWTATNNELQINLNKRDAEINHQYVNVIVRDVEDLAGNTLVNPQMMLVYVDRNVLNWDDPKVSINVKYGTKEKLTPKLINKSGRNIYYTLENNCTWLKMSQKSGVSMPLSTDNIELEISDGLAPGEYFTTVYAVDEDNLSSPLTISVSVEAEEPDWKVTDDKSFGYTMNIIGRVKLKNEGGIEYYDTDKRDIVAAFYDDVCVGKANLDVDDANNSLVNLTVLGNDKMVEDTLKCMTFLLWNASTNTTTVIVPNTNNSKIIFVNGAIVGCPPTDPVEFTPTNEKEQVWNLETGWNWVSLYIKPKNNITLNQLFNSNNGFSAGDVIMAGGQSSEFVVKTNKDGTTTKSWNTGINAIHENDKYTYQIYVQHPVKATVHGYEYEDNERYITLNAAPENGAIWCHLPYLLSVDQPINVAMSDYASDRVKVGTVIKSRKKFAVMDNNHKWIGSLDYMHPGEGYFIKYLGNDTINVSFNNKEKTSYAKARLADEDFDIDISSFGSSAEMVSEARTMMPVIADIEDMDTFEDGDEIIAFAKGVAVGTAKQIETEDGRRLFFISLNAEEGKTIRFAHIRSGEVIGRSSNGIIYDSNVVTGTLDVPYTIDFSVTTNVSDAVYSVSGVRYGKVEDVKNRKGVFIIGDSKIAK